MYIKHWYSIQRWRAVVEGQFEPVTTSEMHLVPGRLIKRNNSVKLAMLTNKAPSAGD